MQLMYTREFKHSSKFPRPISLVCRSIDGGREDYSLRLDFQLERRELINGESF